jgi:hypothetical protein
MLAMSKPKSLYLTAAIFIREGVITLEDLYPHVCNRILKNVWQPSKRALC